MGACYVVDDAAGNCSPSTQDWTQLVTATEINNAAESDNSAVVQTIRYNWNMNFLKQPLNSDDNQVTYYVKVYVKPPAVQPDGAQWHLWSSPTAWLNVMMLQMS